CIGGSTTLTANGTGVYTWSNSLGSGSTVTVNTPGAYSVTVTDNGCSSVTSVNVVENALPIPNVTGNLFYCQGKSTTLVASGGTSYIWTAPLGNSATASINSPGPYSVTVTNNGCTSVTSVNVTEQANPVANLTGTPNYCAGSSTTLFASGGSSYVWSNPSGVNNQLVVSSPGTYAVTVTGVGGCTSTATMAVTQNSLPIANITGNLSFCPSSSTTLTASGGVSYVWDDAAGAITPSILVNSVGTYTVTVTGANGCTTTVSRNVTLSSVPVAAITGNTTICPGQQTVLTASGGIGYLWNNNSQNASITVSPVSSQNYSVTVVNSQGCLASTSATVVMGAGLNPSITPSNTSICENAGVAILDAGSGYQTYQWTDGSGSQIYNAVNGGTYSVTVTNNSGCTGSATITITANPRPNANITGVNSICIGQSTTLTASGGSFYVWSPIPSGNPIVNVTPTTTTTYNVTVTNALGCTSTAQRIVTVNPLPTPSIAGASSICSGTSTVLTATGGSTFLWSNAQTTNSITVNSNDLYIVTVTQNGCTSTTEHNLTVLPSPVAQISGSTSYCVNSSTVLDASGGSTYEWSNNLGTTPSVTISTPGMYEVTVTASNGCTDTAQVNVTEQNNLNPLISGPSDICLGETATLDAGSGYDTYQWDYNNASTSTITVDQSGTYHLTVTNGAGCTGTATYTVNVHNYPLAAINGITTICSGLQTTITASGGSTYHWEDNSSNPIRNVDGGTYNVTVSESVCTSTASITIVENLTPTANITGNLDICTGSNTTLTASGGTSYIWSNNDPTATINVSTGGSYTVTVTSNGCTSTANAFVNEYPIPQAVINGSTSICNGSSTILIASGGGTYMWSDNNTTQNITVSTAGTYTVTVTNNGCTSSSSVDVILSTQLQFNITGNNAICNGASTVLDAGLGFDTYIWSPNGETGSSVIATTAGVYSVTVSNSSGCTGEASVTVTENSIPNPTIVGDLDLCTGEMNTLTASGGNAYEWSDANGTTTPDLVVTQGGTYEVTVSDNGCTSTASVVVIENSVPNANIVGNNNLCFGTSTTLTASGGTAYIWSDQNSTTTATLSVNQSGTYIVTVTGNGGCTSTSQIDVVVANEIIPTISGNTSICNGSTATLSVNENFTQYTWSNGDNTQSISTTLPDIYIVTVTDANSCTGTASIEVQVLTQLTVGITGDDIICTGETSTLDAGAGFTTYTWSLNNASTQTLDVQLGGTYSVTVTNATGCTGTDQFQVIENALPIANITGTLQFCDGASTDLTASGGDTYDWSGGLGTNPSVTVNQSGNYTVTVTQNACTSVAIVAVTELLPFNITASATDVECLNGVLQDNGSIQLVGFDANDRFDISFGSTYTGSATYNSASVIPSDGILTNTLTNPTVSQDYTVRIFNAGDCFIDVLVTLNETPCQTVCALTVNAQNSGTACEGTSATLSTTSNEGNIVSYEWSGPNAYTSQASSPVLNNTLLNMSGTYSVTITSAQGCTAVSTTDVSIVANPTITVAEPAMLNCATEMVIIGSSATGNNLTYNWTTVNGTIISGANTPNLSVGTEGEYYVTVTNANGCIDTAQTIVNRLVNSPIAYITASPSNIIDCTLQSIILASTYSNTVTNSVEHHWMQGGFEISNQPTVEVNRDFLGEVYLVIVDSVTFCSGADSIDIQLQEAYPALSVENPQQLNCAVTEIDLNGSSPFNNIEFQWVTPAGDTLSGATLQNISVPGNYTFIGMDPSNGCINDTLITVASPNTTPPSVDAGENMSLNCTQPSVQLQGSSTGNVTYSWTAVNPSAVITGANTSNPSVNAVGQYILQVQSLTNFCTAIDTVEVTQSQGFNAQSFTFNPECYGDENGTIAINPSNFNPPYTYSLNGANMGEQSIFTGLNAGTYQVQAVDADGCIWNDTITLTEPAQLDISLGEDLELEFGDSTLIEANINIPLSMIDTILWEPTGQSVCNTGTSCLEIWYNLGYSSTVSATLVDTNGCKVTDNILVRVKKDKNIYIPSGFSPNGDADNDIFTIYGNVNQVRKVNSLKIFDRWGNMVYATSSITLNSTENGWDGTFAGEPMNPAVFVYVFEVEFIDGTKELLSGDVTLTKK
nr:gliding motility-associated C-terminal domain-containing protein [Saprospiraceae bacterium]